MWKALLIAITLALTPTAVSAKAETKPAAQVMKVNINHASASAIADALVGIGVRKANAIVEYREKHGPFTKASDLSQVKGIGDVLVKKNLSRIAF